MAVVTNHAAQPAIEKRSRGRPARSATVDREALLRISRQVFARQGFQATSVREIARDAGVNSALMAHHFGSKEELWIAVVEQIAGTAVPMIEATRKLQSSNLGPRERVERALTIFIDRVFTDPDVGLFFSTAATEQGERLNVLTERLVRPHHDVFVLLLIDAMDSSNLKRNDPELIYWMLMNAISKTVSYSHVIAPFSSLPQRPKEFRKAVLGVALSMLA
ncbi:TetR/AcrR family transcriptional regulator [Caballeronia sp. dw_276]|jgi:AcrR family transcriptional regulator|uniref:TetR/AcrR family transcriptional regulator n=1 Tax=Caballeronia sp. dw_276 TaxID=2719795 RepID=UPI001BD35830|nr:TetR/AcrR family transcriptional regulator [Caballeronia sp. dw_276]